jgi:hypothetical protein
VVSRATGDAAIFVFAGQGGSLDPTVWPVSLDPGAVYATRGRRGMALGTGAGLMANGIALPFSRDAEAAVIVISRQSPDTAPPPP